jgi:DNA topoisomerase IB
VAATAKQVAAALGNTPAVCRKSYINPVVFSAWRNGTIGKLVPHSSLNPRRMEKVALKVLRAS